MEPPRKGRVCILLLALTFALIAKSPDLLCQIASSQTSVISVNVNLVMLQVTVRNRQGGFVSGLQKDDFRVFENGRQQTMRVFQHEDIPVSVGLLVDNSGSMRPKRNDVVAAALIFVSSSNPRDEMFVVNFNEKVTLGLADNEPFSSSRSELDVALHGIPADGRTALYDAIETGLTHLGKVSTDKKALIVISDGGDNASRHTGKEVLDAAARSNVVIYTIGLLDPDDHDRNPGFLKRIARITGGEAFFPKATRESVSICKRIAEDIRNQYQIGYIPTDEKLDNTYRAIKVMVQGTHEGRLLVRARAGYIASQRKIDQPLDSQEKDR